MRHSALMICASLWGCGPDKVDDSGASDAGPYEIVADQIAGGTLLAAWTAGDEVLIVGGDLKGGEGEILHYDGSTLCVEPETVDRALWWIHGQSATSWYAVGAQGLILHDNNGVRTREDVPTELTLYGVYDDGTDVWAVGADSFDLSRGEIWRREAGTWSLFKSADELQGGLFKVYNGWFVGVGVAYRLEGGELIAHHPPNGERLLTVRGESPENVWAVGGDASPVLLHWENDAWTSISVEPRCATQGLNGVWTGPGESVWVAGMTGAMAEYADGEWDCPERPITSEDFHAAWKFNDEVLFVGGNFVSGVSEANYGTVARHSNDALGVLEVGTCP